MTQGEVLDIFKARKTEWIAADEIAKQLDISPSTIRHSCRCLYKAGFIDEDLRFEGIGFRKLKYKYKEDEEVIK